MKKYIGLLTLLTTFAAHACPTCIGRIKKKSPPFFSDEYYQPNKKKKKTTNDAKKSTNKNKQSKEVS